MDGSMLSDEERHEIEAELARYPRDRRVCIDAMKIVQRHRGWVSDESLKRPRRPAGNDRRRARRRRHLLQHDFPSARRPARDPRLQQRQLLDDGLRSAARALTAIACGTRFGRDQRRRPLHAAADRLPGRLRPRAGADDRRRSARRSSTPSKIEQMLRGRQVSVDGAAADSEHQPDRRAARPRVRTSRRRLAALRKALQHLTPQEVQAR